MRIRRTVQLAIVVLAVFALTAGAAEETTIDKLLILKKDRKLLLLSNGKEVHSYRVALGGDPIGPKTYRGDNRTPEGLYVIDGRNAGSHYHRSLHISYPNAQDRARAKKLGKDPGGDVFIHGLPKGKGWIGKAQSKYDWTLGCIAVSNEEIDEIWNLVPNGTPVEIRP
jgi:murein L,D-transpeptidase YafK